MDAVIAEAWQAEEALLTRSVRTDPSRVAQLLAPDFYEIGQSGRRWSRHEIIASLASETESVSHLALTEHEVTRIDANTVLLSYRLEFGSRVSRRSSLWRRNGDTVECLFHQGTPVPATETGPA